jgi:hypothetical protein
VNLVLILQALDVEAPEPGLDLSGPTCNCSCGSDNAAGARYQVPLITR